MGKLTDDEIRHIIKRASIFQKFERQSPHKLALFIDDDYESLFDLADNLDVDRKYIQEAIFEHFGVEVDEPVALDTNNQTDAKITGSANGYVDGATLNEIKANLEYHFNTVGKITRRNKKIIWKATPSGPSRLFSISSSPELEIAQKNSRVNFTLKQSLSTLNKLFIFPVLATFAATMFFTVAMFDQVSGDGRIPMLIFALIFATSSFFFTRFVKRRKIKKKERLIELIGNLQQVMERHFFANKKPTTERSKIIIPDLDDMEAEEEVTLGQKDKS
tara:strand:- start:8732 stop:9556 length:825 start_codon:yes stop_codon:yes gene_type:complete